jgi:hypothetical protein
MPSAVTRFPSKPIGAKPAVVVRDCGIAGSAAMTTNKSGIKKIGNFMIIARGNNTGDFAYTR